MERLWPTLRPLVGAAGLQREGRDVQQIQGVKVLMMILDGLLMFHGLGWLIHGEHTLSL